MAKKKLFVVSFNKLNIAQDMLLNGSISHIMPREVREKVDSIIMIVRNIDRFSYVGPTAKEDTQNHR